MQTNSFTTPDGLKIHTKYWKSENDSERVVIIVHGYAEHSGCYIHVAEAMVEAGYQVYALDHSGHGQSDGIRAHIENQSDYMNNLKQFYDQIRKTHPDAKIYIFAHSMGSMISVQFLLNHPNLIEAIAISGFPTHVSSNEPKYMHMLAKFLNQFVPKLVLLPAGDASILTRDVEMQKIRDNDPLAYHGGSRISIGVFFIDIPEMLEARAGEISLPILFMHGEADELAPISGSKLMYERVSSPDKTLKVWSDMRHEIVNEIGREEVIAELIAWLNKH